MVSLPTVTALVPAHDAEAFVGAAVRSALQQDYPAALLDVVVVDDGSRDATAAIVARLAAEHPGRVRLVRQENRGLVGAVNAAAAHATGVLFALLDADDLWPADKITHQVAALAERPEALLVYGDMTVIDAAGAVLQESWLEDEDPPSGRALGALMEHNLVTASSILARRELFPIPAELPWADWWLAVRAAQLGGVAYLEQPRTFYRFHGDNMSLGTSGPTRVRELRKGLALQRWFLRRPETEEMEAEDLRRVWGSFEGRARELLTLAGSPFAALVDITAADRAEGAELAAQAAAAPPLRALGTWVRACAADPSSAAALAGLRAAAATHLVVAGADELLAAPALLTRWAAAMRGVPGLTLAIDAGGVAGGIEAVSALVDACGLGEDEDLDLLALAGGLPPDQAALVCARFGPRSVDGDLPIVGPDGLPALRELLLAPA
jgi:hypothetical protein